MFFRGDLLDNKINLIFVNNPNLQTLKLETELKTGILNYFVALKSKVINKLKLI